MVGRRSHMGGREEGGWEHAWEGVVGVEVGVGGGRVARRQKGGGGHHLGLG